MNIELLYYKNHEFKILEDKFEDFLGGELETEISAEDFKKDRLLERLQDAFKKLSLGLTENRHLAYATFRASWRVDTDTNINTYYYGLWPKSITELENGTYKVIFDYGKKELKWIKFQL